MFSLMSLSALRAPVASLYAKTFLVPYSATQIVLPSDHTPIGSPTVPASGASSSSIRLAVRVPTVTTRFSPAAQVRKSASSGSVIPVFLGVQFPEIAGLP